MKKVFKKCKILLMKLLTERKTIGQAMALMAMMAAINIIASVVAALSIIASIFLIIFLPLTSTIVAVSCKEKYYPIYALATVGLSLVATIWNIDITLFYVVPSILSGFVFGFCLKRSIYFGWSIIVSAIIQTGISFAIVPLINVLFEIDFIGDLLAIFKISSAIPGQIFIVVSFFVISLIQTFLSYFVVKNEVSKFHKNEEENNGYQWFVLVGALAAISAGPIALVSVGAAYTLELISIVVAGFVIFELFKQLETKLLIVSAATLLVNVFLLAIFYNSVPDYYGLLIFAVSPLIICVLSFCVFFLKKHRNDIK